MKIAGATHALKDPVIPRERDERALIRGPVYALAREMGNMRASSDEESAPPKFPEAVRPSHDASLESCWASVEIRTWRVTSGTNPSVFDLFGLLITCGFRLQPLQCLVRLVHQPSVRLELQIRRISLARLIELTKPLQRLGQSECSQRVVGLVLKGVPES